MKTATNKYYKNTPLFWRKLGDSLLGVSTIITASAIANGNNTLAYISLGMGAAGKFLTNFFSE